MTSAWMGTSTTGSSMTSSWLLPFRFCKYLSLFLKSFDAARFFFFLSPQLSVANLLFLGFFCFVFVGGVAVVVVVVVVVVRIGLNFCLGLPAKILRL